MKLSSKDRYWQWAGYASKEETLLMLHPELRINMWLKDFFPRRKSILQSLPDQENINDILYADMNLVLPNDMLTKVDLMSMANGLEVRVPFLDFEFVNFIFSLPAEYKIKGVSSEKNCERRFPGFSSQTIVQSTKEGF